jgi:outer membrane receptor for ferrienterochelin and colicin
MSGGDNANQLNEVVIKQKKDLVDRGGVKGGKLTAKEIMASPVRNVNSIANTVMGVESRGGGTPNIRGARAEGTAYYIDGVRVNAGAGNIPQNAIDQIQVITGGTPAQYGDFVGGAISITTKAPTKNFNRGIEVVTASPFAGYLDNSHFNQTQALISGPIKIINKGTFGEVRIATHKILNC